VSQSHQFFSNPRRWLFARHRHNPIVRKIAKQCYRNWTAYLNDDYQPERNGEYALLERLSKNNDFVTIVDVGANVGEWSLKAATMFPKATIHAFEMVPSIADVCALNCASIPRIIVHKHALSDKNGTATIGYMGDNTTGHSLVEFNHGVNLDVSLRCGDTLLREYGVECIDFLKIDVEGAEINVLKGLSRYLNEGKIRFIQFEYNKKQISSRTFLRDFYDFLEPLGYKLGKIYPEDVEWRGYSVDYEDFLGPNYLAVKVT
jgi:FkbM family methyltransferase